MEIRIVVFLAFACATVVTNTILIWLAYKAAAGLTNKVNATVSDFRKNSEMKQWLESLQVAAAQAATVTQATKERMAEFEPMMARAQEKFDRSLATVDAKLDQVAIEITKNAGVVKDAVAKPAVSVMAFASGLTKVLENLQGNE
jgi:hypothetical protein